MSGQFQLLKMGDRNEPDGGVVAHVYKLEEVLEGLKAALSKRSASNTPLKLPEFSISEASVRQLIRNRRARDSVFGLDLFSDPAWDILLEAFAAHLGQQKISISGLCFGSGAPQTTALRWIRLLEKRGLLVRYGDPLDARRSWIDLSDTAVAAMGAYFSSLSCASS